MNFVADQYHAHFGPKDSPRNIWNFGSSPTWNFQKKTNTWNSTIMLPIACPQGIHHLSFASPKVMQECPKRGIRTRKKTDDIHNPSNYSSGWWFQMFFFYFHPYLGKIPILTNIFQRG